MITSAFERIKVGLEDAIAFAEGDQTRATIHVPPTIDVRAIRKATGMSQKRFSQRYGFSLGRLRDWEQARTTPDTQAWAYLLVIAREREAVDRALQAT